MYKVIDASSYLRWPRFSGNECGENLPKRLLLSWRHKIVITLIHSFSLVTNVNDCITSRIYF